MQRGKILLVDDDPIIREAIVAGFGQAGWNIVQAADSASALRLFEAEPIDLVLADINLPDGSGRDLVGRMHKLRDCAVIYVTSRGGAEDRLIGLEDGDDYVVKPVDMRELLARTRAVLRRYKSRGDPIILIGAWTLDLLRRELADGAGEIVRLTRAEFDLFAALAQAGDIALSRDYLHEVVAFAGTETKLRTVDVLVSRIRRKLAAAGPTAPEIVTVHAQGYRLLRRFA
jgi:two-component system torCAD operon response regulator TorR